MFLEVIRKIKKTTVFRLTLWYSAIFIFSSLVLFGIVYFLLYSVIQEKDRMMIEAKIEEYALQYENAGREAMLQEIRLERFSNDRRGFLVRVADPKSRTLVLTIPHRWKGIRKDELEKPFVSPTKEKWTIVHGDHNEDNAKNDGYDDTFEVVNHRLPDGYLLQIGKNPEEREDFLERFQSVFAGIMIPVVVIGFIGGTFLSLRALRPIKDLNRAARRIVETGNMDRRVPPSGTGDELDELIQVFNTMLERIETLIKGMREALDNVAHDLRTPLTRLRGVIEMTLQSTKDKNALREALMDCAEESERMVTMLDTLMDISEAESGTMQLTPSKTDLNTLVKELVEMYQYVADEKFINIRMDSRDTIMALIDRNRVRQAIANLLDNAIKYTDHGGEVNVRVYQRKNEAMISIKDNGFGIPPGDLEKIFDRLYRGDKSRSQRGLGLGLSLVQAVIRAHNGRIEVQSSLGKGTEITVFLPLSGTEEA